MKNTKRISALQLQAILLKGDFNGCSFAGLTSLTDVELTGGKSNPMQGRIQKLNEGQLVMVFNTKTHSAYERMVKKRLVEAGRDPEAFTLSGNWFKHIEGTTLVAKKSDESCLYLQVIYAEKSESLLDFCNQRGIEVRYEDKQIFDDCVKSYKSMVKSQITYLLDGNPIAKEDIIGLKEDKKEGKQGGLDDDLKVITRVFKIQSILALTIAGVKYIIE